MSNEEAKKTKRDIINSEELPQFLTSVEGGEFGEGDGRSSVKHMKSASVSWELFCEGGWDVCVARVSGGR